MDVLVEDAPRDLLKKTFICVKFAVSCSVDAPEAGLRAVSW